MRVLRAVGRRQAAPGAAARRRARRARALSVTRPMRADRLGDDVAHPPARIEAGVRVLEDHLHAPAQRAACSAGCGARAMSLAVERDRCRAVGGRGRRPGARRCDLPQPDSPTSASVSPRCDRRSRRRRPPAAIWRGRALEHAVQPRRARRRSSASGRRPATSCRRRRVRHRAHAPTGAPTPPASCSQQAARRRAGRHQVGPLDEAAVEHAAGSAG